MTLPAPAARDDRRRSLPRGNGREAFHRINPGEGLRGSIDAILAASAEFRRTVGGVPFRWMTRGEALHIARTLAVVRDSPSRGRA